MIAAKRMDRACRTWPDMTGLRSAPPPITCITHAPARRPRLTRHPRPRVRARSMAELVPPAPRPSLWERPVPGGAFTFGAVIVALMALGEAAVRLGWV